MARKRTRGTFNLAVEVDPDTPGKESLTTNLEGQVHTYIGTSDMSGY